MIEITEDAFKINGQLVRFPIAIEALTAILGEASYLKTKYNHIYVWPEVGIISYAKKQNLVDAFELYFQLIKTYNHSPTLPFNEKISINGLDLVTFYTKAKKKLDKNNCLQHGIFSLYFDEKDNALAVLSIGEYIAPAPKVYSDKYKPRKVQGEKLVFTDFNFKLAIINELMYSKQLLKPQFDLYDFVRNHAAREIDVEEEGYEFIKEVTEYFEQFEIEKHLADEVTDIYQSGGDEIYGHVLRFWDGEDETFNVQSLADAKQFKNLKNLTLFYYDDKTQFAALKAQASALGIELNNESE
jgi:hypothetical protein